jgi:hypothetical protein
LPYPYFFGDVPEMDQFTRMLEAAFVGVLKGIDAVCEVQRPS